MTSFDRDEQLGALWRDGLALADAAESVGLGAPVASCPGWTVADVVWHVGEGHLFWRTAITERWTDLSSYAPAERPLGDELVAWYRNGVQRTVEVLSSSDPAEAVWTWAPRGGTVGWIVRRQAQETAVHRWDVDGEPLDRALAVDGVDEFFDHFSDTAAEGAEPVGGTVHLHATDGDGEWLVSEPVVGGRLEVAREHAKGDAAVRASASDLLLALWRRVPLDDGDRFEVFGDAGVAGRLVARADLR